MPRGSLRCFRKKYSSHQALKRGYLSAPNGASASRQVAVEVAGVVFDAVVGRQVHAAAEPHHRRLAFGQRREHAHVHVHRGHVRVARVHHQRHAHRLERRAGQLGPVLRGRGRQRLALHVAEVAAAALEHVAFFDQLRQPVAFEPAAGLARPAVACEGLAVLGLEGADDVALQAEQVGANRSGVNHWQKLQSSSGRRGIGFAGPLAAPAGGRRRRRFGGVNV